MANEPVDYFSHPEEKFSILFRRIEVQLGKDIAASFVNNYLEKKVNSLLEELYKPIRNTHSKLTIAKKVIQDENIKMDKFEYLQKCLVLLNPQVLSSSIKQSQIEVVKSIQRDLNGFISGKEGDNIYQALAKRIKLSDTAVESLTKLALKPLSSVNDQFKNYCEVLSSHYNNLKNIQNDTSGTGMTKAAAIAGGLISGVTAGALTGNIFVSSSARKSATKTIAKKIHTQRYWSALSYSNNDAIESLNKLLDQYETVEKVLRDNLNLLLLNLLLGYFEKLSKDIYQIGWKIDSISWNDLQFELALNDEKSLELEKWFQTIHSRFISEFERGNYASAASISENALIYVLADKQKSNHLVEVNNISGLKSKDGKSAIGLALAKFRFAAIAAAAELCWTSKEYEKACTLYVNAFHNFKILWDDKNDMYKISTALFRLAILGTSENIPNYLKSNAFLALELVLFHGYKIQKSNDSVLRGEEVSDELIEIACILLKFANQKQIPQKIRLKPIPTIELSLSDTYPVDINSFSYLKSYMKRREFKYSGKSTLVKWVNTEFFFRYGSSVIILLLSTLGIFLLGNNVNVEKGFAFAKEYYNQTYTGSLQFSVNPSTAQTTLFDISGKELDSWLGQRIVSDLEVGSYTIQTMAKGYKSKVQEIQIYRDQSENITVNLEKDLGTLIDVDGNQYSTVIIGEQEWMAENLRTTRYYDRTRIQNVTDDSQWSNTQGAWSYFGNHHLLDKFVGKLYNWYAVNGDNSLCPAGWHVPTEEDWYKLIDNLGGYDVAGSKLKITGSIDWTDSNSVTKVIETGIFNWSIPNTEANNETGFSALPGGGRNIDGTFAGLGYEGYWWSFSKVNDKEVLGIRLGHDSGMISFFEGELNLGASVRCIKD